MCSDTESRDTAVRLNKTVRTLESLREELKTSSGNVAAVILLRSSGEVRCFAREVDSPGKPTFEFPPRAYPRSSGGTKCGDWGGWLGRTYGEHPGSRVRHGRFSPLAHRVPTPLPGREGVRGVSGRSPLAQQVPLPGLRPRQGLGTGDQGLHLGVRPLRQADLGDRRHGDACIEAAADGLVLGGLPDDHPFQRHRRAVTAEATGSRPAEKQDMAASRTRPGPPSRTSTAPATSILPSALRPCPPSGGSALLRCGIAVSSISTRPASGERSGATMARRSLPHKSQADLYEPRPSCFCSCSAAMPLEWVVIR